MEIFVGNLPRNTSVLDLRKLIGEMDNARYRIIRCDRNGSTSCYGHAIVQSQESARAIIARLDGSAFKDRQLVVRRFMHRNDHHERRCRMVFPVGWNGVNRRRGERRGKAA